MSPRVNIYFTLGFILKLSFQIDIFQMLLRNLWHLFWYFLPILCIVSEAYSGPCQTSKMGIFAKVFTESSTLDAWKGSEYTSSFLAANANLYEIFLQVISTSLCLGVNASFCKGKPNGNYEWDEFENFYITCEIGHAPRCSPCSTGLFYVEACDRCLEAKDNCKYKTANL